MNERHQDQVLQIESDKQQRQKENPDNNTARSNHRLIRQVSQTPEMSIISSSLISSIKKLKQPYEIVASNKQSNLKSSQKGSNLEQIFCSQIKSLKNIFVCQICQYQLKPEYQNLRISHCQHSNFCDSCLQHYVIYKVKNQQRVICPHEGCNAQLDTQTTFFAQLPLQIQRKYKQIKQIYLTFQDPTFKLCPKQKCQGIIKTEKDNQTICDTCKQQFCGKRLLLVHYGDCDKKQVQILLEYVHYRRCKRCKFIIQKNQGCNHMTCRCSYQFCYVCNFEWLANHVCKP